MEDDYRLDELDEKCPVCKLLLTLCRSDPEIARLKVAHIDLCGAGEVEDMLRKGTIHPLEPVIFGVDYMKGLIKMVGILMIRMTQIQLHKLIPIIRKPPVGLTLGLSPIAHIKVKIYGTVMEGSEEIVMERYLRVFTNNGSLYTIKDMTHYQN